MDTRDWFGSPRGVLPRWLIALCSILLIACSSPPAGNKLPTIAPSPTAPPTIPAVTPTLDAPSIQPTPVVATPTTLPSLQENALPVRASVPTAVAPATSIRPTSRVGRTGHIVFAYYVPYDTTSWASLVAHADQIDYVATQTVFVNACGGLTTQDDLTLHAFAKAHGIGVIPSVFTVDPTVNHKILTDQATTARVVQALVDDVVTQGYDGLDVDLEGVPATDRPALTAFVRQLSSEMHARGKLLTMAVPAKQTDTKTGWAGAYDYAALAPYVDLVTIMSYDYSWAGGPPGSIAPYNWVDKVISYATSQFPANKVLLGVAFYGYDWNVTGGGRARALRYPQAEALASQYGKSVSFDPSTRSATFRYVAQPGDPLPSDPRPPPLDHEVRYHKPPPCAVPVPTSPPSPPPPPRTGQHTVWIEDAQSVAARLQLAQRLQTAGVATWRLGQEDPAVWQRVAAWRGDNASQAMNGG